MSQLALARNGQQNLPCQTTLSKKMIGSIVLFIFLPLSQIQLINPSNDTHLQANILSIYLSINASELWFPNVPTPHSPSALGQNGLHQPRDRESPFKLCKHPKPWLGLRNPPHHEELPPGTEQLILRGVLMNYGGKLIGVNLLTKSTGDVQLKGQLQVSAREAGSRQRKAQPLPADTGRACW